MPKVSKMAEMWAVVKGWRTDDVRVEPRDSGLVDQRVELRGEKTAEPRDGELVDQRVA
jgi:hypothetical protein